MLIGHVVGMATLQEGFYLFMTCSDTLWAVIVSISNTSDVCIIHTCTNGVTYVHTYVHMLVRSINVTNGSINVVEMYCTGRLY